MILRHALTAVGTLLIALNISDSTETGKLIDAAADGAGAMATIAGLLWSYKRKAERRSKTGDGAVTIQKVSAIGGIIVPILLTTGCS